MTGEEGGSGKVLLWDKGAYEGLDACLMYVLAISIVASEWA